MDAVVDGVLSASGPQWLETEVFPGFRAWQIIFLILTGVTVIIIALCCCIKFRIPRTKQQIEADYQRRIITKKFREQLERIQNSDMDAIDLKAALDLVRAEFDNESEKEQQLSASLITSVVSQAPSLEDNSFKKEDGKDELLSNDKKLNITSIFGLRHKIVALVKKSKENNDNVSAIC